MDFAKILYGEISFVPANPHNQQPHYHQPLHHADQFNGNKNYSNINCNSQPEEFQPPKFQLCDPNAIQLSWLQNEKIGGGLINVGNTCFLNSVLQCLTYCPPLYNFLVRFNGGHSQACKINQFCMLCEMEKLFKRIKTSNGGAIKPVSIVQRLRYINKSFQFGRQEDAHEFLRYIIDHMWKACLMNTDINLKTNSNNNNYSNLNNDNNNYNSILKLDPRIKETTFINHIFGGYHRSQVLCLTCNSRSNTFDFFMDFILDIRNARSLEEALKRFTQSETLQNDNAYKCSKCRKKVMARKKFTVYKAPNVATFQLKRFDSDRIFGGKVTKFISYPDEFDLRPYMSDPNKSPIKYHLSAVLVHVGHSSNSGHYFCFIKNSNNLWYRMDDSNVSLVTENVVLQQQAYVLFYTRKSADGLKQPINGCTQKAVCPIRLQKTKSDDIKISGNNNVNNNNNNNITNNNGNKFSGNVFLMKHNNFNRKIVNNHIKTNSGHVSKFNSQSPMKSQQSLSTWNGSKSRLEEDPSRKRLNDMTDRDRFNEEIDRGKTKKMKSLTQSGDIRGKS